MKTIVSACLLSAALGACTSTTARNEPVSAPKAQTIPVSELGVSKVEARPGDLPSFKVMHRNSGMTFKVYYDAASTRVAESSIPVLASFYRDLASLTGTSAAAVKWRAVVFARHVDKVPLPRDRGEIRWSVDVGSDGKMSAVGAKDFYDTIPHEQTHATQDNRSAALPRWYSEGQADWVGLQVTEHWNAELANKARSERASAVKASKEPLALGKWGGLSVKAEAVLRQLTPEQRVAVIKDPSAMPPGPFSFEEEDYVMDESNTVARYGGALALFEEIEKRAGRAAMQNWFLAVAEKQGKVSNEDLISLAPENVRQTIAVALK